MSQPSSRGEEIGQNSFCERREAFRSAPIGIFTTTPQGRCLRANPVLARLLGYDSPGELMDAVFDIAAQVYADPEDRHKILDDLQAHGEVANRELRFRRRDGSEFWVSLNAYAERSADGVVSHLQGFVMDITERKQAEAKCMAALNEKSGILESIKDAIIIFNAQDGKVLQVNPAYEHLTGYPGNEITGLHGADAARLTVKPEDFDKVVQAFDKALKGETLPHLEASFINRTDGREVPVLFSVGFLRNGDGDPSLIIASIKNITERKRDEEVLRVAKLQAEAASTAKSEFLAKMSHEIRTPISGIMNMLQLLETTVLDSEQQEYVHSAVKAADRLTRLLSDILDLSRVEAGRMTLQESEFTLEDLRDSVIGLFVYPARKKGLDFTCSIAPSLVSKLVGDEARVRQVLFNLAANALRYTDRGRVNIEMTPLSRIREGEERVLFSVSDTGIGIPEEWLREVFEPFRQVDERICERKFQGAGLGLAIVRRLVDLMGGGIAVESEPGKGTTVYVALRFKAAPDPARTGPALPQQGREPGRSLSILFAEDDDLNRKGIQALLEKAGHRVRAVADGRQALDLFANQVFDCILMDIHMPVMNGVEATRRIRAVEDETREAGERGREGQKHCAHFAEPCSCSQLLRASSPVLCPPARKRVPIIALTAYAMAGDREIFLAVGMDDYLAKPVRMEDLQRVLDRVCRAVEQGGGAKC